MDRVDLERWKPREVARLLALLETERRYYQNIVSDLPVGLVIVSSELWLLSANRSFRQTFSLKGDEIARRRIDEVLRVDDLNDRIAEVLSSGAPQHNILYSPPVEATSQFFRVSILPLRNWEDEMETEALLVFEDLTGLEQQGARKPVVEKPAARAEETRPSLIPQPVEVQPQGKLLEDIDALVWECDPTMQLTSISPYSEEMLGQTAKELLSDPSLWAQRVSPEDVEFVRNLYEDAIANRNRFQLEYRCRTSAGRTMWVRESVRVQRDRSGSAVKLSGITTDISDHRRITERVVLSHKMESLSRLTTRVAHDYNNFLMIIGSYGEDLLQLLPKENPLRADVEQIVHAADKVQDLTNKLLGFSRRPVPSFETKDFGQIVSAALQEFTPERLGSVELVRILDPDLGSIDVDPSQVQKAISALLEAALTGANQSGKLTVETSLEAGAALADETVLTSNAVLTIGSSAWDLDVEARRRLFEPSFMHPGAPQPLSEAYWFIKQNRGEISVRGELGRGTTVVVSFPSVAVPPSAGGRPAISIVEPPQTPAPAVPEVPLEAEPEPKPVAVEAPVVAAQPEPAAVAPPGPVPVPAPVSVQKEPETVMVVEDEAGIRMLMRKILVRNGYRVIDAEGALQALQLAKDYPGKINLLVTDLVMPEMGGRELAEQLRTFIPDLPVVFASGYTDDAVIQSGTLPPGTVYLQKPFTLGSLLERVKEILGAADKGQ